MLRSLLIRLVALAVLILLFPLDPLRRMVRSLLPSIRIRTKRGQPPKRTKQAKTGQTPIQPEPATSDHPPQPSDLTETRTEQTKTGQTPIQPGSVPVFAPVSARHDERDTMFARAARKPGTPEYRDYYARRPDLQTTDDRIRAMTPLCQSGARHYDPMLSRQAEEWFERIGHIHVDEAQVHRFADRILRAKDTLKALKAVTRQLGAVQTGFTVVPEAFVYTHKGRLDEDYGRPITNPLRRAVVFLVEMDHDMMQHAPKAQTIWESAHQYYRAARVSFYLTAVLKELGYHAKPHYDAHYDVILPPLAVWAGLGELGRNNILVADRYGSRVRIGAVTTDMPLPQGKPVDLGVQHFCAICKKCASNCPSRALSLGEKEEVMGVLKWPTHVERCYRYWRRVGTDCGICMAVCPYSHRNNVFHNLVRTSIRLNPWMRHIAHWADDLVYGRKWESRS